MPRTASDWITLAEAEETFAAANVPVSRSTLARWAHTGKLQSIQPGRRSYVRRGQVKGMLRPRKKSAATATVQPGLFEELGE